MTNGSQIGGGVAFAGAIAIFIEGNVQHPVQVVFYGPVGAHRTRQALWIAGIQAADEIASFFADVFVVVNFFWTLK